MSRRQSNVVGTGALSIRSSTVRLIAAGAALAVAAACTTLTRPKIEPPTITLDSVRVGRISDAKADVSLKLTLANKSEVELAIDRVEFNVNLDGHPAAAGRTVHVDVLPPGGEAKVDIAGRVDVTAVATALMTLGSQLPLPYEVSGTLVLRNGTALAFSRKGEIPIMRFDGTMGARP